MTNPREAWEERNKLYAEGNKLTSEGRKLRAEGGRLRVEGDRVFLDAVRAAYGNIGLEWKNWKHKHQSYECHLANGEVFAFEEER